MNHKVAPLCLLAVLALVTSTSMMGQTNQSNAARWLAHSKLAPPFRAPTTRAAWESERQEIRNRLCQLLGDLPARPSRPAAKTLSREDRGEYLVEKFEFDNLAGAVVPGYLVLPKHAPDKCPAILYCHWHGGEYDIGKEELFQARHTPEIPAAAYARRGFVVLGIDSYCFGERNGQGPDGPAEKGREGEWSASKLNLWVGRTLWGMILRDDLMALDYLASRPEVDAQRIAVTGMSMGATRAWWLMALDDRLKTGVPIACLTRYENLVRHEGLKAHGIYYFVPNMLKYFDAEAVVALIAPRPVLFMTGDQDATSPADGMRQIESAVRPVYRLYGAQAEKGFQNIIYPGQAHVYTPAMWKKTMHWMQEKLK